MEHERTLPANVAASTRETARKSRRILLPIAIAATTTTLGLVVFFELVTAFLL